MNSRLFFALGVILTSPSLADTGSGGIPQPAWPSTNPMRAGIAAITCTSSGDPSVAGQNEHVLAYLDLRDAIGCGATPIVTAPTEWVLGAQRMFWPTNNAWSVANLGEVFGVDVSVGSASHTYVAAAGPKPCAWSLGTVWSPRNYNTSASNTGGGGEVWRIDGTTHVPLLLASLPNHRGFFDTFPTNTCIKGNSFVGLGQVSINSQKNKVYVANMDDGKIYVLNDGVFNSTYPCVFDHGATKPGPTLLDDTNSLYTQRSRLVFGLEYHPQANRLFYAIRNAVEQDEIWSIGLDATGCPTGTQALEYLSPSWLFTPVAPSLPADIQFSDDGCRMLITQVSIRYETPSVTNVVSGGNPNPGAFTGPQTQLVPLHYAHTARPYEVKRASNAAVGGWTPVSPLYNSYITGTSYSFTNGVSGDYGYGTLLKTPAIDSVVFVSDVIRQLGTPSYKFGLQISPLDDFNRLNGPANFDVPLLNGTGNALATKIQLNDIDILHEPACAKIVASNVLCPVGAGGKYTLTLNITNLSASPFFGMSLSNCGNLPLIPGSSSVTPLPLSTPPISLNNPLAPQASTGPFTVCLPTNAISPAGGTYCFCVRLALDELEGGNHCTRMVCLNIPPCTPPCATINTRDLVCHQGNYQFDLCVTNLQPQAVTTIKFSPAAAYPNGPIPSPNSISTSLANGATAYFPVTLTPPSIQGGLHCFEVTLCGAQGAILCRETICLNLPPCPPRCLELSTSDIVCPTVAGGPYTLNLTIKNLSLQPIHMVLLTQCANPPPNCVSVSPQPSSYITLSSPLAPNATTTIPISLPGLPCTGGKACFCVSTFKQEPGNPAGGTEPGPLIKLCTESVCVQLPTCDCPPCMSLAAGSILCPTTVGGSYSVSFTIKNQQATPATYYAVASCPAPAGSASIQPSPIGLNLIPGGPLANNATSGNITVGLSAPLTGGSYCFCVYLYGQDQETILCKERICVNLPSCRCGEITNVSAVCLQNGQTQISFAATNNTNLYPSPYNFGLATLVPGSGFSPSAITPSPNPITPGASGTFTTTYSGPPGKTCLTVYLSNAARTRCCVQKLCFNNPVCDTVAGTCKMAPQFICKNGSAQILAYVCNNGNVPKGFNWTIGPAVVPGCTSTLTAGAFSPASGTTPTLGPNSCFGVLINVNAASITAGTCAGFQFCFTPAGPVVGTPICCTGKIVCPGIIDVTVDIFDPKSRLMPGRTVGIPITITNPSLEAATIELVPEDSNGLLTYSRVPLGANGLLDPNVAELLITDEHPLIVTLRANETFDTTIFATYTSSDSIIGVGTIGIVPSCIPRIKDDRNDHDWTRVIFGPATNPGPTLPVTEILGITRPNLAPGLGGIVVNFDAQPGVAYFLQANPHPGFAPATNLARSPVGEAIILESDGSFTCPSGASSLIIPSNLPREFFRFIEAP